MSGVLEHALAYLAAGYSLLPIRPDGRKQPAIKGWKHLQRSPMPPAEAERLWWGPSVRPAHGIGIIGGKVSGGALCFDFDAEAQPTFDQWQDLVEADRPGLHARLSVIRTPGAGYHAWARCPADPITGNLTLARVRPGDGHDVTMIQTRGEGGYALVPGSPPQCHPTRLSYADFTGPSLLHLQPITAADREVLIRCARALDRAFTPPRSTRTSHSSGALGDDYDRRGPDWADLLIPHGFALVRVDGGVRYWRRPGKEAEGWSCTTGHCHGQDNVELLRNFSPNTPALGPYSCLGKFMVYALLNHNGRCADAARQLAKEGYGRQRERPAAKAKPAKATPTPTTRTAEADDGSERTDRGGGPTQVQRLTQMAAAGDLWHDAQLQAWSAVPPRPGSAERSLVLPVTASGLGQWLRYRFWCEEGSVPSSGSVDDALKMLQAQAVYQGQLAEPNVRLAALPGGRIALDLGDDTQRCCIIDDECWSVGVCVAARFWRPRGLMPLPVPKRHGSLAALWGALNVGEEDRVLVAAWLLGALNPLIPYPLLCVHGEEGSGKTTAAKLIRQTIDPNACPLRAPPHGEENLLLACRYSRTLAVDNVSSLERGMPDALCRVSTGAGLSRRTLFTDQEETCLSVRRPVLLNGIPEVATSSDLASRAITIECPPIRREGRRTEAELQAAFDLAWPSVLGCLLDATVSALSRLPDMQREPTGRLADWERWVDAGEEALGFAPGSFARRWEYARRGSTLAVLEASPVAEVVRRWFAQLGAEEWQGTPTDLLGELRRFCPKLCEARGFPSSASPLSRQLKRLAPSLLAVGLEVTTGLRVRGHDSGREVRLARSG